MKIIKRKTNVRMHNRETKHKVGTVKMHERNLKPRAQLGTIALKGLRYKEAKRIFPSLKPSGDIDGDGVVNKKDCRPFDVDRQDEYDDEYNKIVNRYNQGRLSPSTPEYDKEKREKLDRDLAELEKKRIREEQAELVKQAARELEERRIKEEQEEATENISDVLAKQKQKERGWFW